MHFSNPGPPYIPLIILFKMLKDFMWCIVPCHTLIHYFYWSVVAPLFLPCLCLSPVNKDLLRPLILQIALICLKLTQDIEGIQRVDGGRNSWQAILREKHPQAETASSNVLLSDYPVRVKEVIFEKIDNHSVQVAAKQINGSCGPTT